MRRLPLLFLLALAAHTAHALDYGSVANQSAVLYDAPSLKAKKLYVASRYLPLEQVVQLNDWVKVGLTANGNNDGEPGLDGWEVDVFNSDGVFVASQISHNGGQYDIEGLAPGTYTVQEILQGEDIVFFRHIRTGNIVLVAIPSAGIVVAGNLIHGNGGQVPGA